MDNICAVTILANVSGALWGGLQLYVVYMAEEFERVLWYQEDLENDRLLEAEAASAARAWRWQQFRERRTLSNGYTRGRADSSPYTRSSDSSPSSPVVDSQ